MRWLGVLFALPVCRCYLYPLAIIRSSSKLHVSGKALLSCNNNNSSVNSVSSRSIESISDKSKYFAYLIYRGNQTYNGYTTNLMRRLRQHNSEIKGGAKRTTRVVSSSSERWQYLFILTSTSWSSVSRAMQVEWLIKYPTRKKPRPSKYSRPVGRLRSLQDVFANLALANTATNTTTNHHNETYRLYVHQDFIHNIEKHKIVLPSAPLLSIVKLDADV